MDQMGQIFRSRAMITLTVAYALVVGAVTPALAQTGYPARRLYRDLG